MIAVLVITDGRGEYLRRSVESLEQHFTGRISEKVMFDDSGSAEHRGTLAALYPQWVHVNAGPRQGFGGAIIAAWDHLRRYSAAEYVAHCEADFVYGSTVDLDAMAFLLDSEPHLAQVALLRQPWNAEEIAAGGIIEQHPGDYHDTEKHGIRWVEHRRFFTTNPCLYRRSLLSVGWPNVDNSEGIFTHRLLSDGTPETSGDRVRFAFWGTKQDPPAVEHIGVSRAGVGY